MACCANSPLSLRMCLYADNITHTRKHDRRVGLLASKAPIELEFGDKMFLLHQIHDASDLSSSGCQHRRFKHYSISTRAVLLNSWSVNPDSFEHHKSDVMNPQFALDEFASGARTIWLWSFMVGRLDPSPVLSQQVFPKANGSFCLR
jgi:hypothetical protein